MIIGENVMINITEILEYNKKFVKSNKYELYKTTKYPNKKIAILTCMDTRLTELLPAALGLKNGDVKIIKNAGAVVTHPFGSVMRSLLLAIYDLEVDEIMVIGHYDCGMQSLDSSKLIQKMLDRNIKSEKLEMIKYCGVDIHKWLRGFDSVKESVSETVEVIKNHPLMPEDVGIYGFIIDPTTGQLEAI